MHDPTGLIHIGARPYDPLTGRFATVDPILDPADDQQINGYTYAHNNPVTFSDPTGLLALIDVGAGGSVVDSRVWTGGTACVDYCGSPADNAVRTHYGRSSQGKGGTTGWVEPGAPGLTYDQAARAMFGTGYGALSGEQRRDADYYVWSRNNPLACSGYLDSRLVPFDGDYGIANELLGRADAHRCFATGDASGCAWLAIGITPLKPAKLIKLPKILKASRAAEAARFCSFSGDTLVLMADGTTTPISQIQPGDLVWATDPETGTSTAEEVLAIWVHQDTLINLALTAEGQLANPADPSTTVGLTTIVTTADHPFWNHTDQQWQPATSLDPGDLLLAADSTLPTIVGLLPYTQHTNDAYNLTITAPHTYYVLAGETPVLVHNTQGCGPDLKEFPDVSNLRGADPDDLLDVIPDHWTVSTPAKVPPGGDSIRFTNPNAPGQSIIYESGWPGAATPIHSGPYLRISDGTQPPYRIPLRGNPQIMLDEMRAQGLL